MTLTATTSRNTRVIDTVDGRIPFPILAANVANAGDIICWDNANGNGVITPAAQANMAYYMGVADQAHPINSGLDGSATVLGRIDSIVVCRNGVFWFYTTAGETYNPGDSVYFNETVSVQTIVKDTNSGARTIPVGQYWPMGQAISRASLSVTGAAGVAIPIWITPKYPASGTAVLV